MNTKSKITTVTAASPDDLAAHLKAGQKAGGRFVCLALSDKKVMVCPFDLPKMSVSKLKERLRLEAVEVLSLPADQISLDFQIINSSKEKMQGIFACAPVSRINEYLDTIKKYNLIPLKITTDMLASLDTFFFKRKEIKERFCLLNFVQDSTICLAIFDGGRFEMMRKISYESLNEAKAEIIQSLRSACAKSVKKDIDKIYFTGEILSSEGLMDELSQAFTTKCERIDVLGSREHVSDGQCFFSINLVRDQVYSLGQRKAIGVVLNLILLACLAGCYFLTHKMKDNNKMIDTLSIPISETISETV